MQTDEGAKWAEVEIVETPEQTQPGYHHRHHGEPLRCRVPDCTRLAIRMAHYFNFMTDDRLQSAFLRGIGGVFSVQRQQDRVEELKLSFSIDLAEVFWLVELQFNVFKT